MGRRDFVGGGPVLLEDVGGSFARFLKNAPKEFRAGLRDAVEKTCFALDSRMQTNAPVGPDAPHIRDYVTHAVRGLSGQVGFINATEPAGPGNKSTIAEVALFNEFNPNQQPFMRPSAEAEQSDFVRRSMDAVKQAERNLSGGGGLL